MYAMQFRLMILAIISATSSASAAEPRKCDYLLSLLPGQTESAIVTGPIRSTYVPPPKGSIRSGDENGSYIIDPQGNRLPDTAPDMMDSAYEASFSFYGYHKPLEKVIRGLSIQASVWAGSQYQLQDSIPAASYFDGCQLLAYDPAQAEAVREVFADGHLLQGTRILQVATNEPWYTGKLTLLFAAPVDGLLVLATSRRYFDDVIKAACSPQAGVTAFEIPADVHGGDSLVWGIRRNVPATVPKKSGPTFLAWAFDRTTNRATIRYRSRDPKAADFVEVCREFLDCQQPKLTRKGGEQEFVLEAQDANDSGGYLGLMCLMGHVVML